MTGPRDELIADVQRWKEAAKGLRVRLLKGEQGFDQGLDWLARGGSLFDAINEIVASKALQDMEDALDEFKQCRYRVRKSLTNAALSEGITVEQLIQAFGVTPKMAVAYAEEDRHLSDSGQ